MYIEFTLILGCVNNCHYCPQKKISTSYLRHNSRPVTSMGLATFKKIINKLPKDMEVSICGMSEPFQNPNCTDMILYAAQKGHTVFLCTTMVGMSKKDLQILIAKVFSADHRNSIIIHLPSERKLENITVNQEYLEKLTLIATAGINAEFHHHDKKVHPLVSEKLDELKITPFYIQPKSRANNLTVKEVVKQKRKSGKLFCRRHNLHGHVVLPDGRVVICCMDYGMQHFLGNLSESSYQSIHRGKLNRLIDRSLLDDNSTDILCRYCHGSQYLDAYSKYKDLNPSPSKAALGLKLLIYNCFFPLYTVYIKSKNFFYSLSGQKSKLLSAKYHREHWLYAPELTPVLPR